MAASSLPLREPNAEQEEHDNSKLRATSTEAASTDPEWYFLVEEDLKLPASMRNRPLKVAPSLIAEQETGYFQVACRLDGGCQHRASFGTY